MSRFRFVHIGVAGALALAAITGVGLVRQAGAAGSGTSSVFVPIVPCRLADTRVGAEHVGVRDTALRAAESVTFAVWGTNGNCTIPTTATGIATNVTAVNPTADSFVTIYPADASPRPTASNLNVTSTSPPTPNQVTVGLSATGAIAAYNNGGTLDLVIDIVGYYEPAGTGATGPQGPPGPPGPPASLGGTLIVSGLNLTPSALWSPQSNTGCAAFTNNSVTYLPIDLMSGANITGVTARYIDDNSSKFDISLYQTARPGGVSAASGSVATINGLPATALTLLPHDAVSPTVGYMLVVFSTATPTFPIQFCGIDVTYTL